MLVSLLQTDIVWEDKEANLRKLDTCLRTLQGKSQLAVLPEMFSTGFSMNSAALAETNEGHTVTELCRMSACYNIAITGSIIVHNLKDGLYYNRGFFVTPQGEQHFYDKHHLFRMGDESKYFAAGNRHLTLTYAGVNISLLICYDLRFPVWSRNIDNAYDMLVYVANWPASRRTVWDTLLRARALENQCYVCGVNRVGIDANRLPYNGGSILISPKGETIIAAPDATECTVTGEIDLDSLYSFRDKFPVWKDADVFSVR